MTSCLRRLLRASEVKTAVTLASGGQATASSSPQMLRGAASLRGVTDVLPHAHELATLAHCPAAPSVKPRLQGANLLHQHRCFSSKLEAATTGAASEPRSAAAASKKQDSSQKQTPITKVPGVGLRNAVRLKAKGFSTVEALQQLFVEEHKQKKEEMIKYLQVRLHESPHLT